MTIVRRKSPNFDERVNPDGSLQPVDMLIMHYTGMKTGNEALERMCDAEAKVSAHYMVEENGRVLQLVDEEKRAWHAGVASWRGHSNINARSIGIEIVNPGHEWGYRTFPEVQMEALIALSHGILSRHDIPARNVVGHSDVAPSRKQDPGELFPWERFAKEGIGLWPKIGNGELEIGNSTQSIAHSQLPITLSQYGYGLSESPSDDEISSVISAFQRHFRPETVDGQWDEACQKRLAALLTQL